MSHTALIDALIGANEIIEDLSNRLDKAEESAEALLSALEKTELEPKDRKRAEREAGRD